MYDRAVDSDVESARRDAREVAHLLLSSRQNCALKLAASGRLDPPADLHRGRLWRLPEEGHRREILRRRRAEGRRDVRQLARRVRPDTLRDVDDRRRAHDQRRAEVSRRRRQRRQVDLNVYNVRDRESRESHDFPFSVMISMSSALTSVRTPYVRVTLRATIIKTS